MPPVVASPALPDEALLAAEAARQAQEKTAAIVRAVVELLRKKGYMQG